jgi:hypothetical protein
MVVQQRHDTFSPRRRVVRHDRQEVVADRESGIDLSRR